MINKETDRRKIRLWRECVKFVNENHISCAESIYQCDHVMSNAYEFIDKICKIVGFHHNPDAEVEDDDE